MTVYTFDPKSVDRTQRKLFDALVRMNNNVHRPLRRVDLPEMPAAVRGQVVSGIAEAISTMSAAGVSVSGVARSMKAKSYDLVEHKQLSSELGWGWKVGDAMVAAAEFTGTDIIHKAINYDEYGWKGVTGSAAAFGSNFIPVTKIAGAVGKGGKAAVGAIRGTNAANRARVTAQLDRVAAAPGMRLRRPSGAAAPGMADDVIRGADNVSVHPQPMRPGAAAGGLADKAEAIATNPRPLKKAASPQSGSRAPGSLASDSLHLSSNAAMQVAMLAKATGGGLIDHTSTGATLAAAKLYQNLPAAIADRIWGQASANFVRAASGRLTATLEATVNRNRVFAKVEVPAILANPNVTSLAVVRKRGLDLQPQRYVTISRSDANAATKVLDEIDAGGRIIFNFVP